MANGRGKRPTVCKQCGALAIDGAVISFRALCRSCSTHNMTQHSRQMHAKAGPTYDAWRESMRALIDAD